MATIVPGSELARRALEWIGEHKTEATDSATRVRLVDEAAMRFNLSPLDVEFLNRMLDAPSTEREQEPGAD